MNIQLQTACQLINDIFHLQIQPINSKKLLLGFSQSHMLHTIQGFLEPLNLNSFIHSLESGTIYYITDTLQIHFISLLLNNQPFMIGPFCSLIMTVQDCVKHFKKYNISKQLSVNDFLAYRSQLPVINEREALHIAYSFAHVIEPDVINWNTKMIDYTKQIYNALSTNDDLPLRQNYSELIRERYQLEQRFIHDVEEGNSHAAILNLRNMQRDVAYLKQIGTTLENERIGAGIVRTMARIAAMRAGLPATTVDLISRNHTSSTFNAKTVEEIYKEKEKMVKRFCEEISIHKKHQYSNLTTSAIYYIEHQYSQNITVEQIADELNVSTNHLISTFRVETGYTPGNYIQRIRLLHATKLLCNTDLSLQDIGSLIGIEDSNYFIKLFKRVYSCTPGKYRKYHRL